MSHPDSLSVLLAMERAEDTKRCTVTLRGTFPGCRVEAVYSTEEVMGFASKRSWDVILIGELLMGERSLDILAEVRKAAPNTAVIVQTEQEDKPHSVELVQGGADYCLFRHSPVYLTELPIVMREVLEKRELRQLLDLSHQRYLRLTENMTDVVYELDPDGKFTHVSQTVVSLLGYAVEDLIGRPYVELIHPDDHGSAKRRFNEQR
ncbi:MAG: PAS domain-containing protein, partial [Nitrospiraceae bacterium]